MNSFLVLYRSKHGQTGKIAEHIAADLRSAGHEATVQSLEVADVLALDTYDAIVIGSSIHAGHHAHDTLEWIRHHAHTLNRMRTAAFSVSLSAVDDTDEGREHTQAFLGDLLADTGWTPQLSTTFAGALQYREYDVFTRLLMRLMMKKGGHPTDTSRDYDYTDWDAVSAFAADVAALAPVATV
jgi:menaquinone-dependent protoporphyrinogen oxidase